MTTDQDAPVPDQQSRATFQFRLVHMLWAYAMLGVALATLSCVGIALAPVIVGFWAYVFCHRNRRRALAEACALLVIGWPFIWLLALLPIGVMREAARRSQCNSHLKQIAVALHSYHDTYGEFPPAFLGDEDGQPMHSWRVLILPWLEQAALYDQYDFEQPWDGPNNRRLLAQMPYVYQCPSDARRRQRPSEWTNYVAVVDPRTAWPGAKSTKLSDFTGGTANTILVLEDQSREILWMEPRDLTWDDATSALTSQDRQMGGVHRREDFFYEYSGGRQAALVDGSVRYLFDGMPRDLVASLLRFDQSLDESFREFVPTVTKRLKLFNCFLLASFVTLALLPLPWVWRKGETNEPLVENADRIPLDDAERGRMNDD
jgi:hypothetical protein